MREDNRVKRWRETKRQQGLKAVTVWLTTDEELRLKALALQWHCSPSAVMQRALAQLSITPPQNSIPSDTLRIRKLIREELAAMQAAQAPVAGDVTGGDTDTPVSETFVEPAPQRKGGRPRSAMGQRILAVLAAHPEGVSAEELRVYLKAEKRLGNTLQDMKRHGVVTTQGSGKALRYFVARAVGSTAVLVSSGRDPAGTKAMAKDLANHTCIPHFVPRVLSAQD